MKTIMKFGLVLVLMLGLGACKDKNAADTTDVADTTAVSPDMETPADTTMVDTTTDDDAPGVTKGEMEQVP